MIQVGRASSDSRSDKHGCMGQEMASSTLAARAAPLDNPKAEEEERHMGRLAPAHVDHLEKCVRVWRPVLHLDRQNAEARLC